MDDSQSGAAAQALEEVLASTALLESLPIGVYCCDADGIIRRFNARAAELWGREPAVGETEERFCGAHELFLLDGSPLPHEKTPMADVLRTAEPRHDQRVILERPDGTRLIVLVNIDPLFGPDGALVGAVNCFQDISELARTHDALKRSRDELNDFFENAAVGLHIVAGDGTILRANRAELDMLGYTEGEYLGRHIADFHMDDEVIGEILARLSRGEKLDNYPARLRAKDGSVRHVLITSSGRFREGSFVHTRCFTLDVTGTRQAEELAQEGERRFRNVLEGLPMAVYTTDAEGTVTFYNRSAASLAGREPVVGKDKWCISWRLYNPDGTPLPLEECPMATTLKERKEIRGRDLIAERPDGSRLRCVPYPTLLFDKAGDLTGAVNVLVDVTERYQAEVESAHLAAIVSSSSDAIVSKTLDGIVQSWNEGASRIFGYAPEEMIGQPIIRIIPPELHQQETDILRRLRKGERVEHFDTERLTKDGRRIDISLTISPVYDRFGRVVGASKVARDITERKQAEKLQRLLIGELNHRVKNTLASVQAIANQTVRLARTPADFANSFSGRIQALAHAHDLLTQNSWQGAEVRSLLRDQLLIRDTDAERVVFSGPPITLDPQPALHLALVLHELGTNARKYGALSMPDGRLSVNWTVRTTGGRKLIMHWRETGGPPVELPSRRGFGTVLIEKSLATHGGEVSVHYGAEGVSCDISLPVREYTEASELFLSLSDVGVPQRGGGEAIYATIRGRRVLVMEDEALIAMDMVAALKDAGCHIVGPAATIEEAAALITEGAPDLALLDVNLNGHAADTLAAALTRADIPFAFLTGYGQEELPPAFAHAPAINKPFEREDILAVVQRLAGGSEKVVPMRQKGA